MNEKKERNNFISAKPVTPKTLMMLTSGQVSQVTPYRYRMMQMEEIQTSVASKATFKKPVSPLPDFMKEYLQNQEKIRVRRQSSLHGSQRVQTSKPQRNRKVNQSIQERAQTSPEKANNRVFRIYKPQTIEISPRSKFKIYSTLNLSNIAPMKKIQKVNLNFSSTLKPSVNNTKLEETTQMMTENAEYIKPAMTFGEKLWRLNEVSIFSMIAK